jgi:hypothetical protein
MRYQAASSSRTELRAALTDIGAKGASASGGGRD